MRRRSTAREMRRRRREAQRKLRASQKKEGIIKPSHHPTRPNRTSPYETVEEEEQGRTEAVVEHARLLREQLPTLLAELSQIPDPRRPLLLKHKLTTLMVYGILMFVLHSGSRRRTNEAFTAPAMKSALMQLFPDLQSIPHHQTLCRLLTAIEPEGIETAHVGLVRSLIRDKKLSDHLVEHCYLIAMDGTQKMVRHLLPDDPWLERKVGAEGKKREQYYVYVLEANLVLSGGVSIPLMSEFLDYHKGDNDREKQDSEQRAFFRLSERLKKAFPRLPIMLLLDGLFAQGPVMSRLRDYNWHYMIVLQDGSLPHVWQEYQGLRRFLTEQDRLSQLWGDRHQHFKMVNDIEYRHGRNGRKVVETIHLVVCEETWEGVDRAGNVVQRYSKWAWISDLRFSRKTVHVRCNLAGRRRWCIEEDILVEKRQGYNYEHCYAENWNAMRGYHYLMRIGHLLNVLASFCTRLIGAFKDRGTQGFIDWVSNTLSGRWIEPAEVQPRLTAAFQLRLLFPVPQLPVLTG